MLPFRVLALAVIGALSVTTAQANVIDFGSSEWTSASGSSYSVDGVGVEVIGSSQAGLTHTTGDGIGADTRCGWASMSGCFDQRGEIDFDEVFKVDFGSSVYVDRFTVTNLYTESFLFHGYREQGRYSIDDGQTWTTFAAAHGSGLLDVLIGANLDSILFAALPFGPLDLASHEYTLKSIRVAKVPEPGSLALFAVGLLGIGGMFRRRRG